MTLTLESMQQQGYGISIKKDTNEHNAFWVLKLLADSIRKYYLLFNEIYKHSAISKYVL